MKQASLVLCAAAALVGPLTASCAVPTATGPPPGVTRAIAPGAAAERRAITVPLVFQPAVSVASGFDGATFGQQGLLGWQARANEPMRFDGAGEATLAIVWSGEVPTSGVYQLDTASIWVELLVSARAHLMGGANVTASVSESAWGCDSSGASWATDLAHVSVVAGTAERHHRANVAPPPLTVRCKGPGALEVLLQLRARSAHVGLAASTNADVWSFGFATIDGDDLYAQLARRVTLTRVGDLPSPPPEPPPYQKCSDDSDCPPCLPCVCDPGTCHVECVFGRCRCLPD
jgi:hypothetical protein